MQIFVKTVSGRTITLDVDTGLVDSRTQKVAEKEKAIAISETQVTTIGVPSGIWEK